jgi:hypothetical protein
VDVVVDVVAICSHSGSARNRVRSVFSISFGRRDPRYGWTDRPPVNSARTANDVGNENTTFPVPSHGNVCNFPADIMRRFLEIRTPSVRLTRRGRRSMLDFQADIKKEIVRLRDCRNWAAHGELVEGSFLGRGLRFPKTVAYCRRAIRDGINAIQTDRPARVLHAIELQVVRSEDR